MRKTKIICTLGPATDSPEKLRALVLAGANIFRLNMSHAPHDWVRAVVKEEFERLMAERDAKAAKSLEAASAIAGTLLQGTRVEVSQSA